jgi:hypothetical protein
MRRATPWAAGLLALLLASTAGFAADAPTGTVCRDDARKLCSGVSPGGGRVVACLQQHESELGAECKAALPTLARCGEELRTVCGADSSPRALRSCLRDNAAKLSPECRRMAPSR